MISRTVSFRLNLWTYKKQKKKTKKQNQIPRSRFSVRCGYIFLANYSLTHSVHSLRWLLSNHIICRPFQNFIFPFLKYDSLAFNFKTYIIASRQPIVVQASQPRVSQSVSHLVYFLHKCLPLQLATYNSIIKKKKK